MIRSIVDAIKRHPLLVALCALADLAFFFAFSLLLTEMVLSVKDHVEGVYRIMATDLGKELTKEAMQLLVSQQDVLMAHYYQILAAVGWFMLGVMISWLILQGLSWFVAHHLAGSTTSPKLFAKNFTLISLCGFILVIGVFLLSVRLALLRTQMVLPLYSDQAINVLVSILFALVAYLVMVALGMLQKKGWYKHYLQTAFLHPLRTALPFVLIVAMIIALNWLMMRSLAVHWLLFGTLALLVVLPSYTVGRMVWISILRAD